MDNPEVITLAIVTKSPILTDYLKKCQTLQAVVSVFGSPEEFERYLGRFPKEIDRLYLDLDTAQRPIKLLPFFDPSWWREHEVEIFLVSGSLEKLDATKVHQKHFIVPPVLEHPH